MFINIVQPHTLGIDRAQAAVLSMLANYKNTDPQVTWSDFAFSQVSHGGNFHITAHGVPVSAHILVNADNVRLWSEPVDDHWFVAMGVEAAFKKMLAEALK